MNVIELRKKIVFCLVVEAPFGGEEEVEISEEAYNKLRRQQQEAEVARAEAILDPEGGTRQMDMGDSFLRRPTVAIAHESPPTQDLMDDEDESSLEVELTSAEAP